MNYHQRRFNHYIKLVFEEEEEEEGEEGEEELQLTEGVDRGRRSRRNGTGKGMMEEGAEEGEGSLREDQPQEENDSFLDSENSREGEDEVE